MSEFQLSLDVRGPMHRLQQRLGEVHRLVTLGFWGGHQLKTQPRVSLPDTVIPFLLNGAVESSVVGVGPLAVNDDLRTRFRSWTLACGVRDGVEAVGLFLDETRWVAGVVQNARGGSICTEEWNANQLASEGFHAKGIPKKLRHLKATYGETFSPPMTDLVLSINRLRNCLVHRSGRVGQRDLQGEDAFSVRWWEHELLRKPVDGPPRPFEPPGVLNDGEKLLLRKGPGGKVFQLGESVDLSNQDFYNIVLTLLLFGNQITEAVQALARGADEHAAST